MPINYFRRSSKSMVTFARSLSTRWLRRWENARKQGFPWSSYTVRTQSGMVEAAHMKTDNSWSGLAAVSHGGKCGGRLGPWLGLPNLRLLPLPDPTSWKVPACFTYCFLCFTYCFLSLSHHFSQRAHKWQFSMLQQCIWHLPVSLNKCKELVKRGEHLLAQLQLPLWKNKLSCSHENFTSAGQCSLA